MERREFMKKTATGSLVTGLTADNFIQPGETEAASVEMPLVAIAASNETDLSQPAPLDADLSYDQVKSIVWLALDRDTSSRSLLKIVNKDSWVVLKPNIVRIVWLSRNGLVENFEREQDALSLVTDLRVVKAVAEYLIDKIGPKRITMAEGPAEWYKADGKIRPGDYVDGWHFEFEGFDSLSFTKIAEQLNGKNGTTVDIVDLNEDEAVYVTDYDPHKTGMGAFQFVMPGDEDGTSDDEPSRRKGIYIPKTIMERDVLITMPVMKTHWNCGTTIFMKNFVGCVHSVAYNGQIGKNQIHKGGDFNLTRGVADLTCAINPEYGVAEGFWANQSHHSGQMGIGFKHNVVIAGGDVVAAEAVANMAMGYNPLDFDLLRWCNMKKLGEWNPEKINIIGPPVKSVRVNYTRASEKYVARGIRKWLMLGPVRDQLENTRNLNPKLGDEVDGNKWTLLDGDAIIDEIPYAENRRLKYKDSLKYPIPGSEGARTDSLFYLALKVNGKQEGLVGQILVGLDGGDFSMSLNGRNKNYIKSEFPYDPTPSRFTTLNKGENTLLIEVKKTAERDEPMRIAVNICDFDGDRLENVTFDPVSE